MYVCLYIIRLRVKKNKEKRKKEKKKNKKTKMFVCKNVYIGPGDIQVR